MLEREDDAAFDKSLHWVYQRRGHALAAAADSTTSSNYVSALASSRCASSHTAVSSASGGDMSARILPTSRPSRLQPLRGRGTHPYPP